MHMHMKLTTRLGLLAAAAACHVQAQDLERDPAAVQTVVVTATRHAMALIDSPAALSVVTRAQIEQRGADSVLDALRGELGVSLMARPISGRKAISLRGMDSRHTLMLVDGKRIGASDGVIGHSDFQNDWIPVEDIERIEVIRGPMSVLYGAEALGGVVNIITRPGRRALDVQHAGRRLDQRRRPRRRGPPPGAARRRPGGCWRHAGGHRCRKPARPGGLARRCPHQRPGRPPQARRLAAAGLAGHRLTAAGTVAPPGRRGSRGRHARTQRRAALLHQHDPDRAPARRDRLVGRLGRRAGLAHAAARLSQCAGHGQHARPGRGGVAAEPACATACSKARPRSCRARRICSPRAFERRDETLHNAGSAWRPRAGAAWRALPAGRMAAAAHAGADLRPARRTAPAASAPNGARALMRSGAWRRPGP